MNDRYSSGENPCEKKVTIQSISKVKMQNPQKKRTKSAKVMKETRFHLCC